MMKIKRIGSAVVVGVRIHGNWAGFCVGFGPKPHRLAVMEALRD